MIGIYKITNILNGKNYIGQSADINLRWQQHKNSLINSNKSWYPEARKESNSINDFIFTVIQECKIEELDELEEYWINYYNAYNNGYNKTIDGQYNIKLEKIICDSQKLNLNDKKIQNKIFKMMSVFTATEFKVWYYLMITFQQTNSYFLSSINISKEINSSTKSIYRAKATLINKKFLIEDKQNNFYVFNTFGENNYEQ